MTQYIQENLPNMDAELSKVQRREIGEETTQMHLAKWFVRYGKYQKFSKDPKFIQRCEEAKRIIATQLMTGKFER